MLSARAVICSVEGQRSHPTFGTQTQNTKSQGGSLEQGNFWSVALICPAYRKSVILGSSMAHGVGLLELLMKPFSTSVEIQ